jgi:hypothetical protein
MLVSQLAAHFGSEYKAAKALQTYQSNLTRWKNKVPELWARKVHDITNGAIPFIPEEYPPPKRFRK